MLTHTHRRTHASMHAHAPAWHGCMHAQTRARKRCTHCCMRGYKVTKLSAFIEECRPAAAPLLIVQSDQFGILHPPCARARSYLWSVCAAGIAESRMCLTPYGRTQQATAACTVPSDAPSAARRTPVGCFRWSRRASNRHHQPTRECMAVWRSQRERLRRGCGRDAHARLHCGAARRRGRVGALPRFAAERCDRLLRPHAPIVVIAPHSTGGCCSGTA